MRDYLKYVSVEGGALSMEMDGLQVTLRLHADNLDLKMLVNRMNLAAKY